MTMQMLKVNVGDKNLVVDYNYILDNNHKKDDYMICRKTNALMKVKKKEENNITLTKASVIEFPEEKKYSFDAEFNVIVANKKYEVADKINPTQVLKIGKYYYVIEETIKHGKTHKEYVVKRIETKSVTPLFPIKKTYLDKRDRIGAFEYEHVEFHTVEQDALISLAHRRLNNEEPNVCYSL